MYDNGWKSFLGVPDRPVSGHVLPPEYHRLGGRRYLIESYLPGHIDEVATEEVALLHALGAAAQSREMALDHARSFVMLREARRRHMPAWLAAEEDLWERLEGIPAYVERFEMLRWGADPDPKPCAELQRTGEETMYARNLGRLQAELLDVLQDDEERGSPAVWVPLLFAGTRRGILSLFEAVRTAVG